MCGDVGGRSRPPAGMFGSPRVWPRRTYGDARVDSAGFGV